MIWSFLVSIVIDYECIWVLNLFFIFLAKERLDSWLLPLRTEIWELDRIIWDDDYRNAVSYLQEAVNSKPPVLAALLPLTQVKQIYMWSYTFLWLFYGNFVYLVLELWSFLLSICFNICSIQLCSCCLLNRTSFYSFHLVGKNTCGLSKCFFVTISSVCIIT